MQKIYFGSVIIQNTRTAETIQVDNKIFLETDAPPATRLRAYILKDIPTKEREKYKILELCFESAKVTGITAY